MDIKDKSEKISSLKTLPLFITEAKVKFYNEEEIPPKKRKSTEYQTNEYNNRRFFKPIEIK